jgi:DNA invertase Pin-like site-specific DNA recombinase
MPDAIPVVPYSRYSPRPKGDGIERLSDPSCERQLDQCQHKIRHMERWFAAHPGFRDELASGNDFARQGLADAIACTIAHGPGSILLVLNWKRFGRRVSLGLAAWEELTDAKCVLWSVEEGPFVTSEGCFLASLIAFYQGQRELTSIRKKTSTAMTRYQREGRLMSSAPPFGWRLTKRTTQARLAGGRVKFSRVIEPDAKEQQVLARIMALHGMGIGSREIARTLNKDGSQCRGGPWHHETVRRIIARELETAAATAPPAS